MTDRSAENPNEQANREAPRKKPRRRWFQFGLRTLLAVTALAAGVAMAWRVYVEPYRRQRGTMALIEKLHGSYQTTAADKWLRWGYGEDFQNITLVDLADGDDPEAYLKHVASLPALETLVVGGTEFTDEHLSRLSNLMTLRWLVLDSTSVSNEAMRLRLALPSLDAYESERRAAEALSGDESRRLDAERRKWTTTAGAPWPAVTVPLSTEHQVGRLSQIVDTKYLAETPEKYNFASATDATLAVAAVRGLRRVTQINLSDTQLTDAGIAHLKHLRRLERLTLRRTPISDAALVQFAAFRCLKHLDLDCTSVTDAGLAHLKALTQLKTLSLNSTRVSKRAIEDLQTALPDCWILQINY